MRLLQTYFQNLLYAHRECVFLEVELKVG